MPSYPIPPWIRPPESIAQDYLRGVSEGAQISHQQQALQQQAQISQLDAALKQQQIERQSMLEQQRMAVEQQYQQQQIALHQQSLQQAQQKIDLDTQAAARTFQAQQQFRQWQLENPDKDPAIGLMQFFPGTDEHMTGYGALAKEAYERAHPFVPSETTVGNRKMIQTAPHQWQILPPDTVTGQIQGQNVVDQQGNPIPGLVGFQGAKGFEVRNIPKSRGQEFEHEQLKLDMSQLRALQNQILEMSKSRDRRVIKQVEEMKTQAAQMRDDLKKQYGDAEVTKALNETPPSKRFRFDSKTGSIVPSTAPAPPPPAPDEEDTED